MEQIIQKKYNYWDKYHKIHGFNTRKHSKGHTSRKSNITNDYKIGFVLQYWSDTHLMGLNTLDKVINNNIVFNFGLSATFDFVDINQVFQYKYYI